MTAANLGALPGWARDLVERAPVARLAYLDDRDRPRVLPVTYTVAGESLWTAIDRKAKDRTPERIARVRYLRRRPEAALCVDHYDEDWSHLAWVQALGSVAVHAPAGGGDGRHAALRALTEKYRLPRSDPPDGPLLELRPERVLWWRAQEEGRA
jgi:PPOX class probable F420-dependent enzyme